MRTDKGVFGSDINLVGVLCFVFGLVVGVWLWG